VGKEDPEPPPEPTPEPEDEPERTSPREISTLLQAYEVLDLPLTATADEIRKRFRDLSKKCHPDRVAGLDEEIRRTADRRFREIRRAYDLLSGE
jgi:DnaJ-class molecular chaperone